MSEPDEVDKQARRLVQEALHAAETRYILREGMYHSSWLNVSLEDLLRKVEETLQKTKSAAGIGRREYELTDLVALLAICLAKMQNAPH